MELAPSPLKHSKYLAGGFQEAEKVNSK